MSHVNKACPIWIRHVTYIWIRHVQCLMYIRHVPDEHLPLCRPRPPCKRPKSDRQKRPVCPKKETYVRALYVRIRNLQIRRTKRHLQKSPLSPCRPRPSCNRQKGTDKKDLYARKETYQKALYVWRRDLQNRRTKNTNKRARCYRVVQELHAKGEKKGFFFVRDTWVEICKALYVRKRDLQKKPVCTKRDRQKRLCHFVGQDLSGKKRKCKCTKRHTQETCMHEKRPINRPWSSCGPEPP